MEDNSINQVTGGLIHEFIVCPRAAWFSYRHIRLENELIILGKILHEKSYKKNIKNVFSENISLDFVKTTNNELYIYEVKKSTKMLNAARWQLLFYLFYLDSKGIKARGKLVVPLEKYNEEVTLDNSKKEKLKEIIDKLLSTVRRDKPPVAKYKKICEKCSYFELCWV